MSDIAELERRINAALERIGAAVVGHDSGGAATAELDTLRQALADEQLASTQLQERIKALNERQKTGLEQLEERVKSLGARAAQQEKEVMQLKRVNTQLRESNQALREANEQGVGEPHLINMAMQAELDSLRLTNDTNRSELDALLSELDPIVSAQAEESA